MSRRPSPATQPGDPARGPVSAHGSQADGAAQRPGEGRRWLGPCIASPPVKMRKTQTESEARPRRGGRGYSFPASNLLNPSSSRTGPPNSVALASLEPAFSPATTYEVFFETEPAAFPPAARIASSASVRSQPERVPVTTTVLPASGPGASASGPLPASGPPPASGPSGPPPISGPPPVSGPPGPPPRGRAPGPLPGATLLAGGSPTRPPGTRTAPPPAVSAAAQ